MRMLMKSSPVAGSPSQTQPLSVPPAVRRDRTGPDRTDRPRCCVFKRVPSVIPHGRAEQTGTGHVSAATSGVLLPAILIPALPLPYVTQAGNKAGHCLQPFGRCSPSSALTADHSFGLLGGAAEPGSVKVLLKGTN